MILDSSHKVPCECVSDMYHNLTVVVMTIGMMFWIWLDFAASWFVHQSHLVITYICRILSLNSLTCDGDIELQC